MRNALRHRPGDANLQQLLTLLPDRWRVVAWDIPLHGPFCDATQELYATSTAFWSSNCVVRPTLPDGHTVVTLPASSLTAREWVPCCAVHVLKPAPFMTREDREQLAEDRRSGIPHHRLDNSLFSAAYFAAYVAGPWHMLDVSPALLAHGTSMPLTMLVMRDDARRMLRVRAVVIGKTAGWGCFLKNREFTGGGGGLCTVGRRLASPAAAWRGHAHGRRTTMRSSSTP